jgi:hypothetical protein
MVRIEGEKMTLKGSAKARVFRRGATAVEATPGADLGALLHPPEEPA